MKTDFLSLSLDELCTRLCENKRTLIVYHVRSDADAVGSAFALREIFRLMNIPAICACSDEVPDRLRFLSDDAQGSVLIEDGMGIGHERVISVDSASPAQLGDMFDKLRKDVDIMIDHHASGMVYADNYIDASAAATGEIIYAIANKLLADGLLPFISPRIINCIYAAISSDTGGFRYSNTTPNTHRIAAQLIEAGANAADINHKLFEVKTDSQMRAESAALSSIAKYFGGRVACVCIPYSAKRSLELEESDFDTVIEIPRSLMGVEIAFAIRQPEEKNIFRVSMRSSCEVNVADICAKFGGGGHVKAAGCTVCAPDIQSATVMLLETIEEYL